MRISFASFVVVIFATINGCTQGTPGGPGTTDTSVKKPAFGQADDTFNLTVPVMSSSLQQGEKAEATIGIKRAKNFDEDVALTFADVPKGGHDLNPKMLRSSTATQMRKSRSVASEETAVGEFQSQD